MSHDNRSEVEKLKDEIEQLKRDRDGWNRLCDEWRKEHKLMEQERDRLRSRAIEDWQPVLVYMNDGPRGPCAQTMNSMAPKTTVHVFPDMDAMKAFAEKHAHNVVNYSKNPIVRQCDELFFHGREQPDNPHRCALCDQNPRDFESKDAP